MKTKSILFIAQVMLATNLFAGGISGGTPPAISETMELLEGGSGTSTPPSIRNTIELLEGGSGGNGGPPAELLGSIPAESILRSPRGVRLVPLTDDSIRRLEMRITAAGTTTVGLDTGEKFTFQKDLTGRLLDYKKAAEIIRKAGLETPAE